MKIVFITHYPDLYGANYSLLSLVKGLKENGIVALILVPNKGMLTEKLEFEKIDYQIIDIYPAIWELNFRDFIKIPYKIYRFAKSTYRIHCFVKGYRPDIIYSNSSLITNGILVSIINKVNHIWHLREYGYLDYKQLRFIPNFIFSFLLKKSFTNICISNSILKHFKKRSPLANFKLVYNGIFPELKNLNIEKDKNKCYNFAMIGFISPEKNQEEAIKAFSLIVKTFPNSLLDIIGSGNPAYIKYLKTLVKELNIESNINFLGYIKKENILFNKYNNLLLCSTNEAFGRVIIEAMGNGLIVFAKAAGGVPEIITHQYNGFLYNDDYIELSQVVIESLISKNLNEIKGNAIITINSKFTINQYITSIQNIIKNTSTCL